MPNEIRRAIVEYGQSTSRLRAIFNVTSGNFLGSVENYRELIKLAHN